MQYCEAFQTFNKSYDIKQVRYGCVYLKNEAVIVDQNDNVYHFVNNGSSKIRKLCGKGVIDFAYAYSNVKNVFGYHILARTQSGRVYGWGRNNFKQVSTFDIDDITIPERLKITRGITPTRVPRSHLTRMNDKYHCCSCFPNCMKCKSDPYEKFKLIACGFAHCMAVTFDGNIIVWGNNKFGQIGNGENVNIGNPIVNSYKISITREESEPSWSCTGCFKATKEFFTQYLPSFLPIAKLKQVKISKLVEIEENTEIVSIVCGSFHSLVLFASGNVYGWGDNRYGQLGRLSNQSVLEPVKINGNIKQIVSTNLYTLVLSNDGEVFAMGDNTYAQLGNNDQGYYQEQVEISNYKFSKIATINQLTLGLTKQGQCYIWGLYKMVKKLAIEQDPQNLDGQNGTKSRTQTSGVGNFAKMVGAVAIGVGIDQGIDAIIRSTQDEPSSSKTDDPGNSNQEKDETPEDEDVDGIDEESVPDEEEDEEEVEEGIEDEEIQPDNEEKPPEQSGDGGVDIDIMGILGVASDCLENANENEGANEQGQYGNNESDENIERLTYVITKPTMIKCKSFDKIFAKVMSLTNFTINFEQIDTDPNEKDEADIIDLDQLTKKKSGMSSEMRRNIKVLGQQLKGGKTGNKIKVFFGDHNKFSVIEGSYVVPKGNLNISKINQTGKQSLLNLKRLKDGNLNKII